MSVAFRALRWSPRTAPTFSRSPFTSRIPLQTAHVPFAESHSFKNAFSRIATVASITTLGVGVISFKNKPIVCEAPPAARVAPPQESLPPPPASSVNVYELSFGTVCGICAGVFLKKGAKALAFLFGGVFILLQYFTSLSLIRVDWAGFAARFESLFYGPPSAPVGSRRPPNLYSIWTWFINFLTADFQQRASFIAGFALGLRLG